MQRNIADDEYYVETRTKIVRKLVGLQRTKNCERMMFLDGKILEERSWIFLGWFGSRLVNLVKIKVRLEERFCEIKFWAELVQGWLVILVRK
jgi:hypothetical protein